MKSLEKSKNIKFNKVFNMEQFKDEILYKDEMILIRKPCIDDIEKFLNVEKMYDPAKSAYKDSEYLNDLWNEHISDKNLYYSVIDIRTNGYIGYCGVKDIKKSIWEIAMELKEEYCNRGYGYRILTSYLKNVSDISGRIEFCCKVSVDNIASQKLLKKAGFKPYGLAEFLLHNEEDKAWVENEFKDMINEHVIELANEFNVEPKKLLSHVLEYRIFVAE